MMHRGKGNQSILQEKKYKNQKRRKNNVRKCYK